ncbi:hypothetical protein [Ferribacterium limneticum]|uniref:hypothetical protein n=1 Tax=Ferribacterium limneticum TaxID=76259 RepID=UPI001CF854C5|nr:hypothetical protein [Ferribacterium limneticum]UCV26727.1 hypothetical protein KI617_10440 [Ferribacterium limneticum]UCV30644.1 hypothetical protein KI608_10440 [Ferribacterium limneticum]
MGQTAPALCTRCGGEFILDGTSDQEACVAEVMEKKGYSDRPREKTMKAVEMMEEVKRQKLQLERDLTVMIGTRLEQFYVDTGLSPESISISMIERRFINETRGRFFLNGVRASLEV